MTRKLILACCLLVFGGGAALAYSADARDPLTIIALGTPSMGGTALTDGSVVTYIPAADFYGAETFIYTISDSTGLRPAGAPCGRGSTKTGRRRVLSGS